MTKQRVTNILVVSIKYVVLVAVLASIFVSFFFKIKTIDYTGFCVSPGVANCFYLTIPLRYSIEMSQNTYHQ